MLAESWDPDDLPFGVRLRGLAGPFDFSAGLIKEVAWREAGGSYRKTYHAGIDAVGNLLGVNVYAEVSLRLSDDDLVWTIGRAGWSFEQALEAVAGLWYILPDGDEVSRFEALQEMNARLGLGARTAARGCSR